MERRRNFPLMMTGAASPRGSYRLLMTDNAPCLVNGLSPRDTLKVKASVGKSHSTPKEC